MAYLEADDNPICLFLCLMLYFVQVYKKYEAGRFKSFNILFLPENIWQ